MRVILRDHVDNLGDAGEVVTVKDGFGRNYLLPKGLASMATEGDVARFEHEKRVIAAQAAKRAKLMASEADKLATASVNIVRAAGEEDKLFGSVTSRDIAAALAEQGLTVDSKKVQLAEPIKSLGMVEVPIKLGPDLKPTVKVWVVKKED